MLHILILLTNEYVIQIIPSLQIPVAKCPILIKGQMAQMTLEDISSLL